MIRWQTDAQTGLRVGIALIAVVLLIDINLIVWVATRPVTFGTFGIAMAILVSLGIMGLLAYWLNGLVRSYYTLDRNILTIVWGGYEYVIPTPQIELVILGEELANRPRFRGIGWPGHWVGRGESKDLGSIIYYATVPVKQQVFIVTPDLTYSISPEDREGFLRTLKTRMEMGPTQEVEPSSIRPDFLLWDFWKDRLGLSLLVGAGVIVLALFGFLCARYASLPLVLPLHFDAVGVPDRLGPQGRIFFLPFIGLCILMLNGALGSVLYQRERVAAHLLWGGSAGVQLLLWVAVIFISTAV